MLQIKLKKSVGKNSHPNPTDVIIVQTCLSNIKVKTKFGMKPLWQGKVDGKNSKDLVCAIENFECSEKLRVTGKIDANTGQTLSKLRQKSSHTLTRTIAKNLANETPSSAIGRHYTVRTGVRLTPMIEQKVARIANAYHALTRKEIEITSGTRPPARQARAMFNNMQNGDRLNVYIRRTLAGQIRDAYDNAQAAGLSNEETIAAMTQVIATQVANGQFISKHLNSGAIDIRSKDMTELQKKYFGIASEPVVSSILLERNPPHWHLQC